MIEKIAVIPLLLGCHVSITRSFQSNMCYGIDNTRVSDDYKIDEQYRFVWNDIVYGSYFLNLTDNFGNNQTHSTCGYVALAMLLRYYDIYNNNNIVSNGYEVTGSGGSSDGTLFEPTYNALINGDDNVPAYYTYLRNYKNSSLHAFLILFDKGALYFNPPTNYMSSTYMEEFGTNESTLSLLAYNYLFDKNLNQYCTIVNKSSYQTSYSNTDILDDIKYEIDCGRPVIVGYGGHARVAYGYSLNMGLTYLHTHEGQIMSSSDHTYFNHSLFVSELPNAGPVGYLSLHF